MDPLLIVSPHLDDAVLGCGQLMAGRPDAVVVTVFAGKAPDPTTVTSYDANCGFSSAGPAMRARRIEDREAVASLRAYVRQLEFVDYQYTPADRPAHGDIIRAICDVAREVQPELILWPVGLGHPDHQLVAEAGRMARNLEPSDWWPDQHWVYEELPYRVLFPEEVAAALTRWGIDPTQPPQFMGTGSAQAKLAAVRRYRSQLWSLDMHACLCPERRHQVAS